LLWEYTNHKTIRMIFWSNNGELPPKFSINPSN
jgi:hypothetical protein